MINNRKDYLYYLAEDAKAQRCPDINTIKGRVSYWLKLLSGSEDAHALHYLRALRKYEYALSGGGKFYTLFYKVRWMRLGLRYGIHILPNTVGYGLRIPHLVGGIIINCQRMGNNCGVNGGVIIGSAKNKMPIIGDNVNIAIGAKVYGGITIGNHVRIAPNSVVFKDIPDYSVVAGCESQIIRNKAI